jgi:UDP-N-acetylmuramate--alanine ligase
MRDSMYRKKAHIHFVGIGGIGMSGIATVLHYQGYKITGCDLDVHQKSVRDLLNLGCAIYQGNNTPYCQDYSIDILVYSSDVRHDHPEIKLAHERGIPTIPRAIMLAELMRTKYSIAVAGAHGKTTTTSLIAHIVMEANYDPTVIIGGHLKSISTNARWGRGEFLIAEADESDRSLVRLYPTLAVVTNIDREHLNTYRDLDDIKDTFSRFLSNLPFYGKAIMCHDDPHTRSLLPLTHAKAITYGLTPEADIFAQDLGLNPDYTSCTVWKKHLGKELGDLTLAMPGKHNMLNALAAVAVALELDIPFEKIAAALSTFKGIDRRFSFKGLYKGAELFDDYGHHPAEIHNTLLVARQRARGKLIVVFQPHRYTRTYYLWDDFIKTLGEHSIDYLLITDIYASHEEPIENITSEHLVKALRAYKPTLQAEYIPCDDNFSKIRQTLDTLAQEHDLVLFLGAGKVNKVVEYIQNTNNQ